MVVVNRFPKLRLKLCLAFLSFWRLITKNLLSCFGQLMILINQIIPKLDQDNDKSNQPLKTGHLFFLENLGGHNFFSKTWRGGAIKLNMVPVKII